MVPTCVSEDTTTFEAKVVPVRDPAGAAIAVLQLKPVPLVHIKALAVVEHDVTFTATFVVPFSDPST